MKKPTIPVPHDSLFKTFLTHADTARDFLQIHLPAKLLQLCDLSTLKLESGSFIESDMRTYLADVLYSLETKNGKGYIYTLVEHQSSGDPYMAFRLLQYSLSAMKRHLDAGHKKLPLVVPLLFSHGRASPWPYTMNWLELFSEPDLARQLYTGNFSLIDVGALADDDIMQHRRIAMLELVLKYIHFRDMAEFTEPLAILLSRRYNNDTQLTTLMHYMLEVGETRNPGELLSTLAARAPECGDTLMTIAEKLREEGRMEGMQLGNLEGKLEVARTMLKMGMPTESILQATGLLVEDLKQIRH